MMEDTNTGITRIGDVENAMIPAIGDEEIAVGARDVIVGALD